MLFNSYECIFVFLPLVIVGFPLFNRVGLGKIFLLASSIVFYMFAGWEFVVYLGSSVLITGAVCRWMECVNRRMRNRLAVLMLLFHIGTLLAAKYANFFIENINKVVGANIHALTIMVPLGISFFTFSQIAYVVGVWRGGERMPMLDYILYIFYFPKLLMGPIVEPNAFVSQFPVGANMDWNKMYSGLQAFFFGMLKKVFFADAFARVTTYAFGPNADCFSSLDVVVIALSYTFEIYFDFSGYTDMAIGVSRMLGIELPINFNSPYKSLSVRDFWKRWHITLTAFLTKYVYFPLGGSREGVLRTYLNIVIVFLVSGLWHGANWTFILWGALHGLFMVRDRLCERVDEKIPKLIRWMIMFSFTNVLWLLFRSNDIAQFVSMIKALFKFGFTLNPVLAHSVADPFPLWGMLLIAFVACMLPRRVAERAGWTSVVLTSAAAVVGICLIGNSGSFVYFNF